MLATLALMTVVGGSDGWAGSARVVPPHLEAMTHQEQASGKQEFPLTPEGVAASIDLLSKTRHPGSAQTLTSKLPREVGKELVRLSQAPEETFRKLNDHLFAPIDDYAGSKLIYCRLIFLLRYRLPPKPGGYTHDDFYTYHEHLVIPLNVGGLEEYKDYPTLESRHNLTISPRDLYDWPWKLTDDGWQLRWFTYRLGGGMQDYEEMYDQFSKLPRREGVNDKMALRANPGLTHALRGQRAELRPRARARVGLLEFWGE